MITAVAHLKSISPISFSKKHYTPEIEGESKYDYEARTWREKCHYDENGQLYIPAMMLKFAMGSTAKYLGTTMQIKGAGKERYTKYIDAGVLIAGNIPIDVSKDDVEGEWYECHANGKRQPGPRVPRCFPVVRDWEGEATMHILEPRLPEETVAMVLDHCGLINGLGRFRPQNQGFYGRFQLKRLDWGV